MSYYIDADEVSLDELRKRIESTDLVPSRASLLDEITNKMKTLESHGIQTLAHLRTELKTPRRLDAVASATGIDPQYLILLRRETESYFPKPFTLKEFDWLPKEEISRLEESGIRNTAALYEATASAESRAELISSTGVDAEVLDALTLLADLTRVQWVSPTTARMLVAVSCNNASKLAAADAGELCASLERINAGDRYFKGKIGLRDIKRLVHAASYVPA